MTPAAPLDAALQSLTEVQSFLERSTSTEGREAALLALHRLRQEVQRAATDLSHLRERYDLSPSLRWTLTPQGALLDANTAARILVGRWADVQGRPIWDSLHLRPGAALDRLQAGIQRAASGLEVHSRFEVQEPGRQPRALEVTLIPVRDGGQVLYLLGEGRDVTEEEMQRRALELSHAFMTAVLENMRDGVVACDAQGVLSIFNRASREMHGVEHLPLSPETWADAYDLFQLDGTSRLDTRDIPLLRAWQGEVVDGQEIVIAPRNREARRIEAHGQSLAAEDGQLLGAVVVMHDVTERQRMTEQLRHAALHDPLTSLPNRALLQDRLQATHERYRRHPEAPYAVMLLDLDGFKQVNDTQGHLSGDLLLVAVAARLREAVRTTDTVSRLGGDEFAVLLDSPCSGEQAMQVAERVRAALSRPFELAGQTLRVSCSVGVAVSTPDALPDEFLKRADAAMYRAKAQGKGQVMLAAP